MEILCFPMSTVGPKARCWFRTSPVYNIKDWNKFKVMRLESSCHDYETQQHSHRFALFLNDQQVTSYSLDDDTYRIERKHACSCQTANNGKNEEVVEIYNELKEFRNETMWNMLQNKQQEQEQEVNDDQLPCKQS